MTSENSPISDLYPTSFQLDLNGADKAWRSKVLLPLVNMERITSAMNQADSEQKALSPKDQARNKRFGEIYLFFAKKNHQRTLELLMLNQANTE